MSDQSRKSPKQEIFERTANRVKQYIEQETAIERMLRWYPHLPKQGKEEDRKSVLHKVQELEKVFWPDFSIYYEYSIIYIESYRSE
jgi:hypothetical protein